ncbi:MAG: protein kinase [Gemmataceae bacterium]
MPPADLPPELAAHPQYAVERELGRGGMGVVYLARNRRMDRPEVLKVLAPEAVARPGARDRFLREIWAAARLHHPNVVTAYSVLELGRLLALAMEYVDGRDLARVVRDDGPLPVAAAVSHARQALAGLQHAHEAGLIHRDIKPANLILRSAHGRDTVKVLDFGLAKASAEAGSKLTETGTVMGTPAYIAPEQTLDSASADIRADVYSAGCTLFHLLAGRTPFIGSMVEVIVAHRSQPPPPLGALRPDVPPALAAVVARMLAKDPADRFATPAEAADALEHAARPAAVAVVGSRSAGGGTTTGLSAAEDESPASAVTQAGGGSDTVVARPAVPRVRRTWVAGLALGLVVTAVVGGWLIAPRPGPSADPDPEPSPPAAAEPQPPGPPAADDGSTPLFNGTDLNGWQPSAVGGSHWRVEGGRLTASGPSAGYLHTERADFGDFHLKARVRVNRGGTGGVGFGPFDGTRFQVNITANGPPMCAGSLICGPPYRALVDFGRQLVEPDVPFDLEVRAEGGRIRAWVNGEPTADHTLPADEPRRPGPLTLQQFDGQCVLTFDSIRIKELHPPAAKPAPAATGPKILHYWQSGMNGKPVGTARLQFAADGRILNPQGLSAGGGTWRLADNGRRLVLRWPNKRAPGGVWVDTYTSADGVHFSGRNNDKPPATLRGLLTAP